MTSLTDFVLPTVAAIYPKVILAHATALFKAARLLLMLWKGISDPFKTAFVLVTGVTVEVALTLRLDTVFISLLKLVKFYIKSSSPLKSLLFITPKIFPSAFAPIHLLNKLVICPLSAPK